MPMPLPVSETLHTILEHEGELHRKLRAQVLFQFPLKCKKGGRGLSIGENMVMESPALTELLRAEIHLRIADVWRF